MKNYLKRNSSHILAVLLFALISIAYSSPLLENKKLNVNDLNVYTSISYANTKYIDETGDVALWNNNLFSGMPSYLITTPKYDNVFIKVQNFIYFGGNTASPFNMIFWYLLGFYIMLTVFKVKPLLSIFGAVAFAFSSYFFIIIDAGHMSKIYCIGLMAPIFAGVYMAFEQKRIWTGMAIMAFFLTMQILLNHLQITYYLGLIILIYGIFEFVDAIKQKFLLRYFKTIGILSIGVVLAIGINTAALLTTFEYTPYSLRGKTELSSNQHDRTTGLDKSYATNWSYGQQETFSLIIPNIKGGISTHFDENSETFNLARNTRDQNIFYGLLTNTTQYFGDQPFTSGPVYVGAFICFLFLFSLFVVKGKIKWVLLTATLLSILLAWGHNFIFFTHFFLDYFPGYNKFRTVTMILVIAEFCIPLLAVLGIAEILKKNIDKKKLLKYFYTALGTTIVITVSFALSPSLTRLSNQQQQEVNVAQFYSQYIQGNETQKSEFAESFVDAVRSDRASLVRHDALRSLLFIVLGALLVYLLIENKIKAKYAIIAMTLIVILDMWQINKRYLNDKNYASKRKFTMPFSKTKADEYILKDNDPHYRVLNVSDGAQKVFNDGRTSLYHKSIGGYHGAKMRRYQELCDSIMYRELEMTSQYAMRAKSYNMNDNDIQNIFDSLVKTPILNMLNTKYIIYDTLRIPIKNNSTLGNAWFVDNYILVENPDEEISKLRDIDPANDAIISRQFQNMLNDFIPEKDNNANITLTGEVTPDKITYQTNASTDQLAIFSENYYSKGWNVYIDGNKSEHFRANYILRAMRIPKGEHKIEFKFEPQSYKLGVIVSYICSTLLLLMVCFIIYKEREKIRKK